MTREGPATVIHRADYTAPAYWIDTVDLCFDLDPAKTRVLNKMRVRRNADVPAQALKLDGEELNLARVLVNGQGTSFKIEANQLVLENLPEGSDAFDLEIFTTCAPVKNTSLTGLYVSNDSFFTQCEAEGFRRITYFLDRPDVMASYTVTLRADKAKYPVLLSNGNLVEEGKLEGPGNEGRHFAKWVDPHKKPCYLFALVAGTLVAREQRITARNGQEHLLQVYVRPGDLNKTEHAMNSLMASTYLVLKMFRPLFSIAPMLKSLVATIMKRSRSNGRPKRASSQATLAIREFIACSDLFRSPGRT